MSMKKKILILSAGLLGVVLLLLLVLPLILKPKLESLLIAGINDQIDGTFKTEEIDLSLIRHFPNASVSMNRISVVNNVPFDGDTLLLAEYASLDLSFWELIKRGEAPRKIRSFEVEDVQLNLKIDAEGNTNYDLNSEDSEASGDATEESPMVFDLSAYQIRNADISYEDLAAGIQFSANNLQHKGSGQISAGFSELITESVAELSLKIKGLSWFEAVPVKLNATLGIDLENDTYSFKRNEAFLRELPLTFTGSIRMLEEAQEWKITVRTPSSEFQNFLALIPEQYSHYQDEYRSAGDFSLSGEIEGIWDEERIPRFDILMVAKNGYLKYAQMPKALEQVQMKTRLVNTTGLAEDTFVEIGNATFSIGSDKVQLQSRITDLLGAVQVDGEAIAAIDLAQLQEAYPSEAWSDLKGRVDGRIASQFTLDQIRAEAYENTKTSGQVKLSRFEFREQPDSRLVQINSAAMSFTSSSAEITELHGKMGQTDFNLKGTMTNLLGYLFNDEEVKGNFALRSQTFDLNEFLIDQDDSANDTDSQEEKFEIPGFLDATMQVQADRVLYDDLVLNNVKGDLVISDKSARIENAQSDFLGGSLLADGILRSTGNQPEFSIQLALKDNGIADLLEATSFFEKLAPIANSLQGTMDSRFVIQGNFSDGFNLDYESLSGQAQTELKALNKILGETSLFRGLQQKLDFLEDTDLDLKGLKTVLKFQNGKVEVSPVDFMYKDIAIRVRGSHTFEAEMDYSIKMDVPAHYLGEEVNRLIGQLGDPEIQKIPVPVQVSLTGDYNAPEIRTDLSQSVTKLTTQLVDMQKERAIQRGKDEVKDRIGEIFGSKEDTLSTEVTEPTIGGVIQDVLGGGAQKEDSLVTAEDSSTTKTPTIQETATGILGSLLKKKKKDSVVQDSVNQ